jgi:hypothetical protein
MHVEAYDRATDLVTLSVSNPELAALMQRANA